MRGEQTLFNLKIKKKSGLDINPDIHHSKVFSSGPLTRGVHRRFCTSPPPFYTSCLVLVIWINLDISILYKVFKNYLFHVMD